jgi:large subunit ribosomal protein L18
MANTDRATVRAAIHRRIRHKVKGSTERPRLAIYRSLNHIYAQLIDDRSGKTIVSASTIEKELRGSTGGNVEAAQRIGKAIAQRALEKGIDRVVFDRGGYLYHGRVKALTDAARRAGLNKDEAKPEAEAEGKTEAKAEKKARGKAEAKGEAKPKKEKSEDKAEAKAKKEPRTEDAAEAQADVKAEAATESVEIKEP